MTRTLDMDFRQEWFQALERYHHADPILIYFPCALASFLPIHRWLFLCGLEKWQAAPVHIVFMTNDLRRREVPVSQFPYIEAQGRL